jgi:DNA excision repair protein ERCC-6
MAEDEDRVLLSSLGITSANPEDIERDILAEVLARTLLTLVEYVTFNVFS